MICFYPRSVPVGAVGVTVAVVLRVNAVALQAAGALTAARLSAAPVRLHATGSGAAEPPAERRAL